MLLRCRNRFDELRRTLLGEAVQRHQLVGRQGVGVGDVVDEAGLNELLDAGVRETADVHRAARGEMNQSLQLPSWTGDIRAVGGGFFLVLLDRRPADRARPGHLPRLLAPGPLFRHGSDDLWDDFAGALHLDDVPDAKVLLSDQSLVMQRRQPDDRAADLHRLEYRERIQHPRPADIHLDVVQPRLGDVRRELARDRPPGLPPADDPELVLQRQRVDLHHAAVDGEIQLSAELRLDVMRPRRDVVQRFAPHVVWCHRNPPLGQRGQHLALRSERKRRAWGRGDGVAVEAKGAHRRDGRVELPERAGRGIARVREDRLAGLHARLVHLLEPVERVVHFAANLDDRRRRLRSEAERHVAERPDVRRDVLADRAVAAGCARHQHAVAIR